MSATLRPYIDMEPFGFTAKLLGEGGIKNIKVKKPKGLKKKILKICLVAFYDKPGILRTYSNPDPHGQKLIVN